jgi:hypothetical protein
VPDAACLDAGFWSPATVKTLTARSITPDIAVGKVTHGLDWQHYYGTTPTSPPPPDASPHVQMAYQVQTPEGHALYRQRKSTIEPVFGIIKEVLGFRQFALRDLAKAAGEWRLVCLAYNLKRFFTLQTSPPPPRTGAIRREGCALPRAVADSPPTSFRSPQLALRTRNPSHHSVLADRLLEEK